MKKLSSRLSRLILLLMCLTLPTAFILAGGRFSKEEKKDVETEKEVKKEAKTSTVSPAARVDTPAAAPGTEYIRNNVLPALVHIEAIGETVDIWYGNVKLSAVGSGYIVSKDGDIITNYHVAGGAERVRITFSNGKVATGYVVGGDPVTDVAVVRPNDASVIKKYKLPVMEFGDSEKVKVGEYVYALGNPYAMRHNLTAGVVSNPEKLLQPEWKSTEGLRDIEIDFIDWIQHDAPIFPGNSGGPLVNSLGKVIGMNTRGGLGGLSLAVPAHIIKDVYKQIKEVGYRRWSWIGISLTALTNELKETNKLPEDLKGVFIQDVVEDSPADKAGIKKGDILLAIGSEKVYADFQDQLPDVIRKIAQLGIGSRPELTILRGKEEIKVYPITEDLILNEFIPLAMFSWQKNPLYHFEDKEVGFKVARFPKNLARQIGISVDTPGVLVLHVDYGSIAHQAGMRGYAGGYGKSTEIGIEIITRVNKTPVKGFDEFPKIWREAKKESKRILVSVQRLEGGRIKHADLIINLQKIE